jgi:tRNA-2-methylthio-N6-dimethylallyladenosine synthase
VEEVVVEGPSRKDASLLTGRTRQNKLVHFASPAALGAGTVADVLVTAAAPHHLAGDLVEVVARPRHKTRIPVTAG